MDDGEPRHHSLLAWIYFNMKEKEFELEDPFMNNTAYFLLYIYIVFQAVSHSLLEDFISPVKLKRYLGSIK